MENWKFKDTTNHRYVIINPAKSAGVGKHSKFRVQRQHFDKLTWKPTSVETIKNESIASINKKFMETKLDFDEAKSLIKDVVGSLYKAEKSIVAITFSEENQKALALYLDRKYPAYKQKQMADYESAKQESTRGIEALGKVSIFSASNETMQHAIDAASNGDANKQRRLGGKVNAILKVVRPDAQKITLQAIDYNKPIKRLTHEEFKLVLPHLPNNHIRLAAEVCFYLGCRIGEACALTMNDFRPNQHTVFINKQVVLKNHDKWIIKPRTKNKKIRQAILFANGLPALKKWTLVKKQLTSQERGNLAEILKSACIKVFPFEREKHLNWHDLRHCYAIRLIEKGLSIQQAAKMIGDSPSVAEQYYIGFDVNDETMNMIKRKVVDSDD